MAKRDGRETDSPEYLARRAFYDKVLTIYGRNAVLEALQDSSLRIHRLHFSNSNQLSPQLKKMLRLASERNVEILHHDKSRLSRISKNAKQDQGVALDIVLEHSVDVDTFISSRSEYRLIALDSIHNPQNLGMIIRSCAAGSIDGIILPAKNSARISPLVIKASAGALFKMPLLMTNDLAATLRRFKEEHAKLYTLSPYAEKSYKEERYPPRSIFILGNESEGVSAEIEALSDDSILIPMQRDVESLNVAVTASLLAFM